MDNFVWKDGFATGIQEIDQQHQLFLDYLNECYNAACSDKRAKVTDATIYDLKAYANTHFRFEEALMLSKRYQDLWNHAQQHEYFEMKVAELEKLQAEGKYSAVTDLGRFLREWFLGHIPEHDKKLTTFLSREPQVAS
jgi:hemerythrin-like metal-binding protein